MLKVFDILINLLLFIKVGGEVTGRLNQRNAINGCNYCHTGNPIDPFTLIFNSIVQKIQKRYKPSHIEMIEVTLFWRTYITVNDRDKNK